MELQKLKVPNVAIARNLQSLNPPTNITIENTHAT